MKVVSEYMLNENGYTEIVHEWEAPEGSCWLPVLAVGYIRRHIQRGWNGPGHLVQWQCRDEEVFKLPVPAKETGK
jgi:hypothetical protein